MQSLLSRWWFCDLLSCSAVLTECFQVQWINTGQIPCNEDGGHHRPNKHAEISRLIFRELEWISSGKNTSPKEFSVIRKIHPCLPSFKSEFTASVPLTRIRDIAHRNDIPHDLKQEIKHTIQNKLHRNAGPEDLVATEVLLSRVTKNPGDYSEAFIEQLKLFYAELKDFFNAGSLTEQLEGIRPAFDEHQVSVLDDFLLKKKNLDEVGQGSTNGTAVKNADSLISTLHALTSLRAAILKGLNSGLRNDAPDEAIAMRQKWRLCEIGLEDYSFVLLSRFINALNMAGGATWLAEELRTMKIEKWRHSLAATVLGIRQLGLSDWHQEECMALENELMAWQAAGITGSEKDTHNWALRLKATLDRARRLCESYTDTILHLYPESVQKLGNALGIPDDTVRTYAEAEIRASVVFQLAKLCSLMLKSVRTSMGGAGWDALMPGKVVGKLVEVERIVPGSLPSSESIILLVKKADGDEEVKAAGANVVGIILQHELPHLSHLGVRARQEKVVFVTCEDEEQVARVRTLLGQSVKLQASPDGVNLDPYETKAENELTVVTSAGSQERAIGEGSLGSRTPLATLSKPGPVSQSRVIVSPPGVVLELSKAVTANAGAKAAACGKLAVLAESSSKVFSELGVPAKFSVPKGKVIPFGAMEAALQDSGDAKQFYSLLQNSETGQIEGGFLDNICNELQAIVSAQRLPKSVIDDISSSFPGDARLIVRSSANVEDLAGMSGAGLYESIPNVRPSDPETFGKAVAQVWASLYTRRAVLSRRMAGVPQKDAAMAVLVQELLSPNLSFVLHTVSPIDQNDKIVQAELAVGLGETLASGTRGSPWRLAAHKFDGSVRTLAYANFSEALIIQADTVADGQVVHKTIDYSKEPLSVNQDYTKELGQRLATAGFFLEQKFGVPQDIEGCVIGKEVFIVQARPQP
ncbi:hypothetical protein O6H91_13G028200 [Diphasiastrum complanatum]|uniref:Uncharacterized protein n=1 Tax=Diphasiastrum complanatum TaxID=34168 RepID=A0ACC2BTG9_DIPCM|nr:hypothetical protein O6H91_13G028200 [Diphasiastrum complanatum]